MGYDGLGRIKFNTMKRKRRKKTWRKESLVILKKQAFKSWVVGKQEVSGRN